MVELVVDSAVAESTGISPAYVTFGQCLSMAVDYLDGMHAVCNKRAEGSNHRC